MKKFSLRGILDTIKAYLSDFFFDQTDVPTNEILIISEEASKAINQLTECSGSKNPADLICNALSVLEIVIHHELRGGKVLLVEENGVNSEELNCLSFINRSDQDWKDFSED